MKENGFGDDLDRGDFCNRSASIDSQHCDHEDKELRVEVLP